MFNIYIQYFNSLRLDNIADFSIKVGIVLACTLLVLFISYLIKKVAVKVLSSIFLRNKSKWGKIFLEQKIFQSIIAFIPIFILSLIINNLIQKNSVIYLLFDKGLSLMNLFITIRIFTALIRIFIKFNTEKEKFNLIIVKSVAQFLTIITYTFAVLVASSIIMSLELHTVLASLSALTAVLLFVFKDTIMGLVHSLQIANSNIVTIGDWINVKEFEADGIVENINIVNTKILNWDKTITYIPTPSLVTGAVQNFNNMSESNTRFIKKKFYIDMDSICFLNEEEISKFKEFKLLKKYLTDKEVEIKGSDSDKNRLTNMGVFRAYVLHYLESNPNISQKDTILVRYLDPTFTGIPFEIYCFTNTSAWIEFEKIQSDILDHIIPLTSEFNLNIYQTVSKLKA